MSKSASCEGPRQLLLHTHDRFARTLTSCVKLSEQACSAGGRRQVASSKADGVQVLLNGGRTDLSSAGLAAGHTYRGRGTRVTDPAGQTS